MSATAYMAGGLVTGRRLWSSINEMDENQLRLQVVIPILRATPGVTNVTDVHGQNERGLDVIFMTRTGVETICYGLQLKVGNISGGGTGDRTVKQIVDQLQLATDFKHPIATENAGEVQIDRFVVATSGTISSTAREEIARRITNTPVNFWDGNEIIRRIHESLPQFFNVSDGTAVQYLASIRKRYDALDSLDQIPGVAKRTLSQVYEAPYLRRRFDPTIAADDPKQGAGASVEALALLHQGHNAVLIGDQDGGKTSTLRMLAISQASVLASGGEVKHRALPLLLRAKDILRCGLSIEETANTELRRHDASDLITTLVDDLRSGSYFLAVDGFSELSLEEDKELVARRIIDFTDKYPEVRVIIAARPVDFLTPKYFSEFFHYGIEEFSEKQTASLVKRWTGSTPQFADVAKKMITRVRDALQLPGSPIPATIGVMLHEEQGRYITNTAEAIDRYMVIRLGRYAHELGMKQEIDWARKQDLLAEVAFGMVNEGKDSLDVAEFVSRIESVQRRQGETPAGKKVVEELIASGVLAFDGRLVSFYRTSFRDFFAAHHINQRGDLDRFAVDHLFDRQWGGACVFAAGLRRNNSRLLNDVSAAVSQYRARSVNGPNDDYYYASYFTGRLLSNSESSDNDPKKAALKTCMKAAAESVPDIEKEIIDQYGNVGKLLSLLGAEQTFFITIGVPWIRNQLKELLSQEPLDDEERYLVASTYAHLGYDDSYGVLERAIKDTKSTRVLVTLRILIFQLLQDRRVEGRERASLDNLLGMVRKRLANRSDEVRDLWKFRSKALEVEQRRLRRIDRKEKRERGETS